MPNYHGKRASDGFKSTVHTRPSREGGDFFTRIIQQPDSIIHASSATDASGRVVPGSQHGFISFTGPNPSGSFNP
jgi:hypothetical protein